MSACVRFPNRAAFPVCFFVSCIRKVHLSGVFCGPPVSAQDVCVRFCQRNMTGFPTISAELKCELFDLTTLSIAKSIYSVDCRWISVSMEHWWFETRRGNRWTREQDTQSTYEVTFWRIRVCFTPPRLSEQYFNINSIFKAIWCLRDNKMHLGLHVKCPI